MLWRGAAAQLCKERLVLLLFRHMLVARHKNYLINPSPWLASQAGWRLPTQLELKMINCSGIMAVSPAHPGQDVARLAWGVPRGHSTLG